MVKKRILVTGSEGYIGTVLVNKLIKKGYDVTGIDLGYYEISKVKKKREYKLLHKDIRSLPLSILSHFDAIIHLAALSNDPLGELNESLTNEINYEATIELAKKAKISGVKRFIFSSSCSVYGFADQDIVDENSSPHPLTSYAHSKINSEKTLQLMSDDNFCISILRNATVYGFSPNFRNDLVVNNFVTWGLVTKNIRVISDGTPWRPLIDVRDLADIFLGFLTINSHEINRNIYNIGFNENNVQVRDILTCVKKILPNCSISYIGDGVHDRRSYRVSFNKIHEIFPNIVQKWPLERSIRDMIKNLKMINFSEDDLQNHTYARLSVLQGFLKSGKLDNKLNWVIS